MGFVKKLIFVGNQPKIYEQKGALGNCKTRGHSPSLFWVTNEIVG